MSQYELPDPHEVLQAGARTHVPKLALWDKLLPALRVGLQQIVELETRPPGDRTPTLYTDKASNLVMDLITGLLAEHRQ